MKGYGIDHCSRMASYDHGPDFEIIAEKIWKYIFKKYKQIKKSI
jgi:hypothetical protein